MYGSAPVIIIITIMGVIRGICTGNLLASDAAYAIFISYVLHCPLGQGIVLRVF